MYRLICLILIVCAGHWAIGQGSYLDSARLAENNAVKIHFAEKGLEQKATDSIQGELHLLLSEVLSNEGKTLEALDHAHAAIDRFKGKQKVAEASNRIGRSYTNLLQYRKALAYLEKSLLLAEEIQDSLILAKSLVNIGNAYFYLEKKDSALDSYEKADKISSQRHYAPLLASIANNIAGIYLERKDYKTALDYYKRTVKTAEIDHDPDMPAYLNNIAEVYAAEGKINEALDYKLKAEELSTKEGYNKDVLSFIYPGLAELYARKGNYKAAYRYDTLASALNNSFLEEKTLRHESELDARYKVREKELENKLLKNTNAQNERLLLLQWMLGGAITLVLIVVSALAIRWNIDRRHHQKIVHIQKLQKAKIQQQKQNLEAINQELSRVMKVVAHDMRSPINSIFGLTALLHHGDQLDPSSRHIIDLIQASCQQSKMLIDEIMQVDFIGQDAAEKEDVELSGFLTNCVTLLQFNAEPKKQIIHLHAPQPAWAEINRDQMLRVINNVVGNAIKFSPQGSTIDIDLVPNHEKAVINIVDHGIGIPEQIKDQVFHTFTKAKRVGTAGEKPFGLGLSISKRIVDAHGGKIWFDSQSNGTTFHIELPTRHH